MGYKGEIPTHHQGDASVHLDRGSGVVYQIVVAATNTRTIFLVYDGSDTAGDLLLRLAVDSKKSMSVVFSRPLSYKKGLYIEVDSGLGGFTIFFDHLES